ncbi:MAG: hypothetical protein ACI3VU_07110 [Faecousia sp.]
MKRMILFALLITLLVSLSGCFLEPAENLYAIPKQSSDYYELQSAIEKAMPEGASYCPPTAGDNQQSVQLADLDGDGKDEAVVYLKTTGSTPLSVCVFGKREGKYSLIAKADFAGSSFDHVEYVQIDGTAGNELVIGRQISDQVAQTLGVYALRGDALQELLTANYSEFITADLNEDGNRDLVLLRADTEQLGVAEYYHWKEDQLLREREASMTAAVTAVRRIITGKMCESVPAVFVASEFGEGTIVTDIFGLRGGEFVNLTLTEENATGVKTVRDYYVYSNDIDSDGLIELPRLIAMREIEDDETSKNRSLICWYNLYPDGTERIKCLTYHNYSGGWYLEIPQQWEARLAVSRAAVYGTTLGYRFLLADENGATELFSLTAVSGDDAAQMLQEGSWQKLTEKGDQIYLCAIADTTRLDFETLQRMFHFIRVDWKTGETE